MKSANGSGDYLDEKSSVAPQTSLKNSSFQDVSYCAWSEIPMEVSIPGESFRDPGRMTYSLPLTHSALLNPSSIRQQEFVVRNLALRHGDTHLPLKLDDYCNGNPTKLGPISFGSRKLAGFLSQALSAWSASAFGRWI